MALPQAIDSITDHVLTLPAPAVDALTDHAPDWFPIPTAAPPSHTVTIPEPAVDTLTHLPTTANIPDWFVL
jgi:hypothetical protein